MQKKSRLDTAVCYLVIYSLELLVKVKVPKRCQSVIVCLVAGGWWDHSSAFISLLATPNFPAAL